MFYFLTCEPDNNDDPIFCRMEKTHEPSTPATQSVRSVRNNCYSSVHLSLTFQRSPYLLPNAEPEPFDIAEHIVSASSKMIAIDKILADVLPKGERVLIFSVSNKDSTVQTTGS